MRKLLLRICKIIKRTLSSYVDKIVSKFNSLRQEINSGSKVTDTTVACLLMSFNICFTLLLHVII